MSAMLKTALSFFQTKLLNNSAKLYASKRCIDKDTLTRLGVGYWPMTYRKYTPGKVWLEYAIKICGLKMEELISGGLIRKVGDNYLDLMSSAFCFPLYRKGTLISMYFRSADELSSIKHCALNKGKDIFNEQAIRDDIVYVTEGLFDCLSLEVLGYNAIATLGLFTNDDVIERIAKASNVIICYDNDENGSGIKGAKKLGFRLCRLGSSVNIVSLPSSGERKTDINMLHTAGRISDIHNSISAAIPFNTTEECKEMIYAFEQNKVNSLLRSHEKQLDRQRIETANGYPLEAIISSINASGSKSGLYHCVFKDHNDSTASFRIRADNTYICYGCGRSGDAIQLIREMNELSFWEAIEWIEGRNETNS